jgi:NADH:ubiquinone oxidoreductase subunit 2 (subunit N)
MDLNSLSLITPELILSVLALGLLIWEAFCPTHRKAFITVSMMGLLGSSLYFVPKASALSWTNYGNVLGMLAIDTPAIFCASF